MIAIARALFLSGLLFLSGGCGSSQPEDAFTAAVSIPPQAYLASRIGGPYVRVVSMLRPGESPETFQPSDSEISRVLRSRVYFRIRVPFEEGKWFQTIERAGDDRLRIVDTTESISFRQFAGGGGREHLDAEPEARGAAHGHEHGRDPHVWLSPSNLAAIARAMAEALKEIDPAHAAEYDDNLAALEGELNALHEEVAELLAPYAGRSLYVYHPAWGYFCEAFGLRQISIEVEGKEPSDAELSRLQEQARGDDVRVIFVQVQNAGPAVTALARAVGAEVRILDPLAEDVVSSLRSTAQAVAGSFE